MRATERYERAWNAFQIHLNHNPKSQFDSFFKGTACKPSLDA